MDCRHGGLVTRHHNEVQDALGDLASLLYKDVVREPVVCEREGDGVAMIADLGVSGVWQPRVEALFDIQATDTDAPYVATSVSSVLAAAEEKRKYGAALEVHYASFTPFVVSVDGAFGGEAALFIHHLADRLSMAWCKQYSVVQGEA